jgi:hypothetical protein
MAWPREISIPESQSLAALASTASPTASWPAVCREFITLVRGGLASGMRRRDALGPCLGRQPFSAQWWGQKAGNYVQWQSRPASLHRRWMVSDAVRERPSREVGVERHRHPGNLSSDCNPDSSRARVRALLLPLFLEIFSRSPFEGVLAWLDGGKMDHPAETRNCLSTLTAIIEPV